MIWHGYREIYNNIIINTYVYYNDNDNHINYNQTGWESFRLDSLITITHNQKIYGALDIACGIWLECKNVNKFINIHHWFRVNSAAL